MVEISASILGANVLSLRREIASIEAADRLHIDVMDGHFVPNITFGFPTIREVAAVSDIPVDVHLMVTAPEEHLDRFTGLDIASVSVHIEATDDLLWVCERLRRDGIEAGVCVNPETELEGIESVVEPAQRITIMGVNPGYSGQSFLPCTVDRIKTANQMLSKQIEVDGGIDPSVSEQCIDAGADILVSGSTIFESSERDETIGLLRNGDFS